MEFISIPILKKKLIVDDNIPSMSPKRKFWKCLRENYSIFVR